MQKVLLATENYHNHHPFSSVRLYLIAALLLLFLGLWIWAARTKKAENHLAFGRLRTRARERERVNDLHIWFHLRRRCARQTTMSEGEEEDYGPTHMYPLFLIYFRSSGTLLPLNGYWWSQTHPHFDIQLTTRLLRHEDSLSRCAF